MLKNYFTLALFFIFIGNISSQNTYVPDDNFEQALIDLGYDDVLDDYVLTSNIYGVTNLNIENKGISDLTGIEGFTSLTHLWCPNNQLTTLDLSQNIALTNLSCHLNQLTSINVSQNTALSVFSCSNNQLTSLDLSQNTALLLLYCEYNQLTSLDVTQNTNLWQLHSQYNQLISIDVSQNTALTLLSCHNNKLIILNANNGNNSLITNFLAPNNPSLTCIQVDNETDANNGIAPYTNWLKDATATYSEDCGYSQTTYVPDDNFEQALIDLGIDTDGVVNNNVATVEIIQVTSLNIESKNISDLTGIEAFTSLTTLIVSNNQLTYLDLSYNTNLIILDLSNNPLITLILANNGSGRTTRTAMFNSNNNLLNIDIRLTELVTIDISNVPNLESLDAQGSKLIVLDVSNNNNLMVLNITNNPLSCVQVNQTQLNNIPSGWVKDTAATYSTNCEALSLDDVLLAKSITLYPNPVSDILSIDSKIPLTKVEIYSILGQKVREISSGFNSIPMSNLSNGIYIVRLQSENGFFTKKLIKK